MTADATGGAAGGGGQCGVEYEQHPTRRAWSAVCTKPAGHDGPHDNLLSKPGADHTDLCECDFDPDFHRTLNARLGIVDDDRCHHEAADHMNGWPGGVISSPALCMGCLFGCAP